MQVRRAQSGSVSGKSVRKCPPRLSVRAQAEAALAQRQAEIAELRRSLELPAEGAP